MIRADMNRVVELVRPVGGAEDLDGLKRAYANSVRELGGAGSFGVYLFDPDGVSAELSFSGAGFSGPARCTADLGGGRLREILEGGRAAWPEGDDEYACLPLTQAGTVFGFVRLEGATDMADFARAAHELLADELARALVAIELRDDLSNRLAETESRLRVLTKVGSRLNTLKVELVAARFITAVLRAAEAQVGALLLRDEEDWGETFQQGIAAADVLAIETPGGGCAATECAETTKPVIVDRGSGSDKFAFIPLAEPSGTVGVCCMVRGKSDRPFDEYELELPVSLASLAATAIANARYHAESLERERWQAAVAVANAIQQGLMPKESLRIEGLDVAFYWVSSEVVGGDYLDLIPTRDGALRIVVGDVTGHGVGPALLMTSTRAALRMLGRARAFEGRLIDELNRFLMSDVLPMGLFVTMFIAELDPRSGAVRYVNAGHNPAIVVGADSSVRTTLSGTGFPLGILEDAQYESAEYVLAPGEKLVAYTDGLIEARSPAGEQLGMERFKRLVSAPHDTAAGVIAGVKSGLDDFCRSRPPLDDQTLVIVKRL